MHYGNNFYMKTWGCILLQVYVTFNDNESFIRFVHIISPQSTVRCLFWLSCVYSNMQIDISQEIDKRS